jgi:hypothetical protein
LSDWLRNIRPGFERDGWDHDEEDCGHWAFVGPMRKLVRFSASVSIWTNNLSCSEYWQADVERQFNSDNSVTADINRQFDATPEGLEEAMAWAEGVIAAWDYLWVKGGGG